jgi:aconitate decarboxylase
MTGLTEAIGRFVGSPGFESVPDDVLPIIKAGFIDAAGVLICGQREMPVPIVKQYVEQSGQTAAPEASLFFGAQRISAEAAALVNATACHVLDYDDVGLRAHPSTVLAPAILAEAERRGASGAAAIRAYLVGYEAGIQRLQSALWRRRPRSLISSALMPKELGTPSDLQPACRAESSPVSEA